MVWFAIALLIIGLYLAFKVLGFAVKMAIWGLLLGGLYWIVAPQLGFPLPL